MDFTVNTTDIRKHRTACVVVGIYESKRLTRSTEALDKISRGFISDLLKRGDIKGKVGTALLLQDIPRASCERVLLIGCGKQNKALDDKQFRKIAQKMAQTLKENNIKDATCYLTDIEVNDKDTGWIAAQLVTITSDIYYNFDQLKSKKGTQGRKLQKLIVNCVDTDTQKPGRTGIKTGKAIAHGVNLAKDLANLPGNICTPGYLADQARVLAKKHQKLTTKVIEQKQMETLKMGAFLSVARGSRQAPKLITMEYTGGNSDDKPIVLVGKGITFDSGGISIKPSPAMDEMKFDMCGAASVFGTIASIAELELPINVVGVVPSCENLPDGNASKPGDVVTSMSGKTIEVLNTDAEGRLILCDALTFCDRFNPEVVIDIATLTGACVIALGKHASGLLSNDQPLADDLLLAGKNSDDRAWQMPLWDNYQEQLRTNFADMANVGGREAGTITAACFLSRFTEKYQWAHLDIAGTAWRSGHHKGATGRPVPLLVEFLINKSSV
ncbi:MAG: leucyl aminopeptidase [Gammaproteobacteria bacterium]